MLNKIPSVKPGNQVNDDETAISTNNLTAPRLSAVFINHIVQALICQLTRTVHNSALSLLCLLLASLMLMSETMHPTEDIQYSVRKEYTQGNRHSGVHKDSSGLQELSHHR